MIARTLRVYLSACWATSAIDLAPARPPGRLLLADAFQRPEQFRAGRRHARAEVIPVAVCRLADKPRTSFVVRMRHVAPLVLRQVIERAMIAGRLR